MIPIGAVVFYGGRAGRNRLTSEPNLLDGKAIVSHDAADQSIMS